MKSLKMSWQSKIFLARMEGINHQQSWRRLLSKIAKWYSEICLVDGPRDDSKTIKDLRPVRGRCGGESPLCSLRTGRGQQVTKPGKTMSNPPAFRRMLITIGEALVGSRQFGIDLTRG